MLVPLHGFGTRTDAMEAWLREHVGIEGYAIHGAGRFHFHAVHYYLDDPRLAAEFVKGFDLKLASGHRGR